MPKLASSEHYVRIPASLYESPAFRTLPPYALKLWVDLRTLFKGLNNGNISATLGSLRWRGWRSSGTLDRALWTLLERGLLRRVRAGKPGPLRVCALYAFTDLATARDDKRGIEGRQPTREYATWVEGMSYGPNSKAQKLAINPNKKKTPLQKSKRQRFTNQIVPAPEIGELMPSTALNIGAEGAQAIPPKAAPVLGSGPTKH